MSDRIVHLVDDDEAIRRSAGFLLKTSGFHVVTYASGDDFLRVARNAESGCVLLDIRMPGLDGLGVQQAMNDRGIGLPVVMLTGHGDVGLAVRAMKAGAVDFLEKPFLQRRATTDRGARASCPTWGTLPKDSGRHLADR